MAEGNKLYGNIYILLTAILLSFSTVYTYHIVQNVNPVVFAFYSFLLVFALILVLRVAYFRGITDLFSTIKIKYKHLLGINITSAIDWILFLIALKYINGFFVNAIVFGITPVATLLFVRSATNVHYFLSFGILFLLLIIGLNYINVEKINELY